MHSQVASDVDKTVQSQYLRNGLPSLLLAVFATAVAVYSHWFVSPVIEDRYVTICERNFERLNLNVKSPESLLVGNQDGIKSGSMNTIVELSTSAGNMFDNDKLDVDEMANAKGLSNDERARLFEDTQLCLRRLTIAQPDDEILRFQSAVLANVFANWHRYRAWEFSKNEDSAEQVADCLAEERYQLGKATEAMRSVERLNGPLGATATAGIIERQIREAALSSGDELESLSSMAKQGLQKNTDSKALALALARILVLQALAPSPGLTDSARLEKLAEATQLFVANAPNNAEELSWLALAQLPTDREKAQENSWNVVQQFWANSSSVRLRAFDLDSALRSMLVGGVFEEAESFVDNQLKKLPAFEQADLRILATDSCIRQVIAVLLGGKENSNANFELRHSKGDALNEARLLDFAVRLRSDSSRLIDFLVLSALSNGSFATDTPKNPENARNSLRSRVALLLQEPKLDGFNQIVAAIVQSIGPNQDESRVRESVANACRNGVGYSFLAMRVVLSLAAGDDNQSRPESTFAALGNDRVSPEMALVWLRAINETSPDLLDAWFARGNIHLAQGEKNEATACFAFLQDRLPDNAQVAEKLGEAKRP